MKNLLPEWGIHFDISGKEKRVEELERKLEEPGFWDDAEHSQKIMKELKELKDQLDTMKHLQGTWEDIQVLIEMAHEEND